MKKLAILFAAVFLSVMGYTQQGTTQLSVGPEIGFPTGDFKDWAKTGFGGTAKALFGIGTNGQVTLTAGYLSFGFDGDMSEFEGNFGILPILAGYRQNFNGFYIEPQAGIGIYNYKVKFMGEEDTDSESAFTWSLGAGYVVNQVVDIGVRYQSADVDGDNVAGFGLRVAYVFNLRGSR